MFFVFTWSCQQTWIASELYSNVYTHFLWKFFHVIIWFYFQCFYFFVVFHFVLMSVLFILCQYILPHINLHICPFSTKAQRKYLFVVLKNTLKLVEIMVASKMQSNAKLLFEKDSEMCWFFFRSCQICHKSWNCCINDHISISFFIYVDRFCCRIKRQT